MKVRLYQTFTRPNLQALMYHPGPRFGRHVVEAYEKTGKKTCPCGHDFEESHHPGPGTYLALGGYWPQEDSASLTTEQFTEFSSEQAWQEFNSDPVVNEMRHWRNEFNARRGITVTVRIEKE